MTVAVIIPTYNRPAQLARCLDSIARLSTKPDRVIVVDNASLESVREIASRTGADYVVAPHRGVSRARNIELKTSREDILAFTDDDMGRDPDWLSQLLAPFSNATIGAVTGPVLPSSLETLPPSVVRDRLKQQPWGPHPFQVDRSAPDWFERANFGGLGDGNFAFRRTALENWPGFDERIGRSRALDIGEDHYAFFQMLSRGYAIAYAPEARVFHPAHAVTRERLLQGLVQSLAYAGFVALENPRYAIRVASFVVGGALLGRRRSWHVWTDPEEHHVKISPAVAARCFFAALNVLRRCYAGNGRQPE